MNIYTLNDLILSKNQGINTTTEKIKYCTSGHKVLRAKNILDNKIDQSDLVYIDDNTYNTSNDNYKPKIDDVLYTNIGSQFGSACVLKTNDYFITWNILRLVPNKKLISPLYLSYLLNSNKERLRNLNSSSTMPFVSGNILCKEKFNIHSLEEQQHIVNIIGSIDDLIESNNKLVLKLLSILNNKLEYLITKSTEFIPLKSIISERKEKIGLNDVKLLSVVNTGELVLQDEYFDKNTASADMKKYKLIRKFDYAYNPARINIGSIGMLKENYLGAISPIYVVFEIDENYKYYLDFYKSSEYMRKYIEKKSSGSVRQNLPFDEFASIEIPNINTEFLKEFNSLCELYYRKINDLKTKTIKLQAIKDQYLKKFFG